MNPICSRPRRGQSRVRPKITGYFSSNVALTKPESASTARCSHRSLHKELRTAWPGCRRPLCIARRVSSLSVATYALYSGVARTPVMRVRSNSSRQKFEHRSPASAHFFTFVVTSARASGLTSVTFSKSSTDICARINACTSPGSASKPAVSGVVSGERGVLRSRPGEEVRKGVLRSLPLLEPRPLLLLEPRPLLIVRATWRSCSSDNSIASLSVHFGVHDTVE